MPKFTVVKIVVKNDFTVEYYATVYDLSAAGKRADYFLESVKQTASYRVNTPKAVHVSVKVAGDDEIAAREKALKKAMASKWFQANRGTIVTELRKGFAMARLLADDLLRVHNGEDLAPYAAICSVPPPQSSSSTRTHR